jgi:hypothetical protein
MLARFGLRSKARICRTIVFSAVVHIWHRAVVIAKYRLPVTRMGAYLVAAFIVSGLAMLEGFPFTPHPGIAIGLLGLAAVFVAVRSMSWTLWESVGWICVASLLFYVEVHSINVDRDQHDREQIEARRVLDAGFSDLLNDQRNKFQAMLDQSQAQFDATMASVNNATNTVTGGNSFCYLSLSPGLNGFGMNVIKVGKYPLRFRSVRLFDQTLYGMEMGKLVPDVQSGKMTPFDAMQKASQTSEIPLPISDFATDGVFLGSFPYPPGNELDLNIVFNGFNGGWIEYYSAKKVDGKWRQGIYIDTEGLISPEWYKKIEPGFPVDAQGLAPGWPHPVQKH